MSDHYSALTEAERAHWDEYTRLRELSDWDGFTDEQDQRRADARCWLVAQRKEIWRQAQPTSQGGDGHGWDYNNRSARYQQLKDDSLNAGTCRRVASLPRSGCTDTEKALLAERCTWWMVSSTTDAQKARKQACTDWLISRRKEVYGLIQDGTDQENKDNNRSSRYEYLSISTKKDDAYANWLKTHNASDGSEKSSGGGSSARQRAVDHARSFLGVSESPPESNRGNPQPSDWQERVLGYDGQPWCACFTTCMCWDVGVQGSGSAGVSAIVNMAQQHSGMFRGWTTDPNNVQRGDMAVIGCTSCHIGLVAETDDPCHTIEGNTSPSSSGSQYNGGCVAEKHRGRHEIMGWALVDYPG
jgi:hypothetical protein